MAHRRSSARRPVKNGVDKSARREKTAGTIVTAPGQNARQNEKRTHYATGSGPARRRPRARRCAPASAAKGRQRDVIISAAGAQPGISQPGINGRRRCRHSPTMPGVSATCYCGVNSSAVAVWPLIQNPAGKQRRPLPGGGYPVAGGYGVLNAGETINLRNFSSPASRLLSLATGTRRATLTCG